MTDTLPQRSEAAEGAVTDAEIDALVQQGWDWHSAYRHLQTVAHSNALRAKDRADGE